jgi:uncharacterized membrane protein
MDHARLLEFLQAAAGVAGLAFAILAYRLIRQSAVASAAGRGRLLPYAFMGLAVAFVVTAALFPWRITADLSPEIIHLRGALQILNGSAKDELARIAHCVDSLADPAAGDRRCAEQAKTLLVDLGNDIQVIGGNVADVGCLLVKVSEGDAKGCQ